MSDLRQEVLTAQVERTTLRDRSPAFPCNDSSASADEADLVGVRTTPGTPMPLSRPSSPTGLNRFPSTGQHPDPHRGSRRSSLDPLRRFPPEIAQRIFLSVPVETLSQCSLVSRHWRRSATLNYAWFRHWQEEERLEVHVPNGYGSYESPYSGLILPPLGQGGAKWTKRQSRTDWKKAYARAVKAKLQPGRNDYLIAHGIRTGASRVQVVENKTRSERMADAGVLSSTAMRQQQWAAEERADADYYGSKEEMRDVYKSYGSKGGKVKGKTGKGGTRTWNEFTM